MSLDRCIVFGAMVAMAACSRANRAAAPSNAAPRDVATAGADEGGLPIGTLRVPPGFHVALYAGKVEGARSLAASPNGTLFVGTRDEGRVYAIARAGDHGGPVRVFADGLDTPNGVAFHGGALYVAERSRVLRYDDAERHLDRAPEPVVVSDRFPDDKHHGWKFIGIGPDDRLYVPVGAPCNVCEKQEAIYASLTRMRLDGSDFEVFARGIRNTVGFAWHPGTHELWFTDNGRDEMGDDVPPDELDRAPHPGMHFGFPYCHGDGIPDPEYGPERACDTTTLPERLLDPHVAALGMRFYTGTMFPPEYQNRIFIAEHGSWNRSKKIGYRVTMVALGARPTYEVFVGGWLQGERAWGRPVDVLVMPDGALLVSDDQAGAIYRVSHARRSSVAGGG